MIILSNIANKFRNIGRLFSDDLSDRIPNPQNIDIGHAEQMETIRANVGTVTLGNILAGFLIVVMFVGDPQFFTAISWYVFFLTVVSFTMGRGKPKGNKGTPNNKKPFSNFGLQNKIAIILGLLWICMPLLLFSGANLAQKFFIVATMLSLIGVGSFFLSGVPRAAVSFTMIMAGGLLFSIISNWHIMLMTSAMLTIAFTLLIIGLIRNYSNFLVDRMEARIALVESNDMISVLLREHEDSGYEWLWETGAEGEIKAVSKKFMQAAGVGIDKLQGQKLTSLLRDLPNNFVNKPSIQTCSICDALSVNRPFRDIVVCYQHPTNGVRWWKLSGRPILDHSDPDRVIVKGFRGVALDITDAKISEDKIAYLALYDSLTNLPNRASFRDKITASIAQLPEGKVGAALFVLDLDKFKHINDTLGHPAGDELLVLVAKRLLELCKGGAMVARLGGDEFAIVLDEVESTEQAKEFAEKMIDCFREPFMISERMMGVNCSIGVAMAPIHGATSGELIKNADLALYRAKNSNNCSYNLFEAEMDLQIRERRRLGQELQSAIENEELYLLYQPLLCVSSNDIIGYEALIRWDNPRCGTVNPEKFIPIAEENGMIIEIGKWVIRHACMEAASWKNSRRVAVNLSPLQFVGLQLESVVALALADSGLRPSRLELEITENSLMVNKDATLKTLLNLQKLGISIALDDFGTGYSSLSYLMSYPFDKIKIDRSFLFSDENIGTNTTLIRTIIGLAKNLGMKTTAEGVETLEHLEFLRREGCDEVQGFLLSQPIPPSEIISGEDEIQMRKNIATEADPVIMEVAQ